MKKIILLIFMALTLASCTKKEGIAVDFEICNKTSGNLTVEFSSWGEYRVTHGSSIVIPHEFHSTETTGGFQNITMSITTKDDGYDRVPPTIIPAWNYIMGIECMRVKVPESYYKNPANWRVYRRIGFLNSESIVVELALTPEVLAEFNKENPYL